MILLNRVIESALIMAPSLHLDTGYLKYDGNYGFLNWSLMLDSDGQRLDLAVCGLCLIAFTWRNRGLLANQLTSSLAST
jgi:hypothetical protein